MCYFNDMYKIYQRATDKDKEWAPIYNLDDVHLITHYLNVQKDLKRDVFSIAEAADYLRVKVSTLKNYTKRQMITWEQVGKEQIFRKIDLDEFLARRERLHSDWR